MSNISHGETSHEEKIKENGEVRRGEARQGKRTTSQGESSFTTQLSSRENTNLKTTLSYLLQNLSKNIHSFWEEKDCLRKNEMNRKITLICWASVERMSRKETVFHSVFQVLPLSYGLDGFIQKHRSQIIISWIEKFVCYTQPLLLHKQALLASIIINNSLI